MNALADVAQRRLPIHEAQHERNRRRLAQCDRQIARNTRMMRWLPWTRGLLKGLTADLVVAREELAAADARLRESTDELRRDLLLR